jgi:hypothetical protein
MSEPVLLGVRMIKHYLPMNKLSVQFNERTPMFQLKYWLRANLLDTSGDKPTLIERIRSKGVKDVLEVTVTEDQLVFDGRRTIDELTSFQLRMLDHHKIPPQESYIQADFIKLFNDRDPKIEREILTRIGSEIEETGTVPYFSYEEIELLAEFGFKYDEKFGYLGVPQYGIGIYRDTPRFWDLFKSSKAIKVKKE